MVHLLRKYQQTLMLLVTVLVIISFVWFYNYNKDPYANTATVGTIYGRRVSAVEFKRGMRLFEVARNLMLFDLLQTLVGQAQSLEQARENFVWNMMVVRHAADQLAITATDEEVIADVQKLPAFQTNGVYDSSKYNMFVEHSLAPNGMTPVQLEELVRDHLRLQKLKTLLGTAVSATPAEVRDAFERLHRKTELSVVRLKFDDFKNAVKLTEEDLKKAFEEQKETLKSDELRKVKYVAFLLPPEDKEKKQTREERMQQMQNLADKAEQFTVAMTEKDAKFEEVAKKAGVEVKESAPFAMQEPPEELGKSEHVAETTFERLTMEQPNSDAVTTPQGYYVLQLSGITPSHPLTYEEAKPKLENRLKEERAQEAMTLKAAEIRQKIDPELKAGKTFAEAATAIGVTAEKIPAFSFAEPPPGVTPDVRMIMGQSAELAENETSPPIPTQDGVALVHVDKRYPVDETKFASEKNMLAQNISRSKRDSVFEQWLKTQRDAAGVNTGQS
jgi:peptidyl-prolyl cis-trans isomerase D